MSIYAQSWVVLLVSFSLGLVARAGIVETNSKVCDV